MGSEPITCSKLKPCKSPNLASASHSHIGSTKINAYHEVLVAELGVRATMRTSSPTVRTLGKPTTWVIAKTYFDNQWNKRLLHFVVDSANGQPHLASPTYVQRLYFEMEVLVWYFFLHSELMSAKSEEQSSEKENIQFMNLERKATELRNWEATTEVQITSTPWAVNCSLKTTSRFIDNTALVYCIRHYVLPPLRTKPRMLPFNH